MCNNDNSVQAQVVDSDFKFFKYNCLIIAGLDFCMGTCVYLAEEFQMICHCGVCVSSTKSLDFLIYFVFVWLHFSVSIFFCHPWKFLLIFMDIYGFHLFLWTSLLTRGLASDQEQGTLMD
jgi:hypothetical protein